MYWVARRLGIRPSWMTMALPHVCTKALEGGSWLQQKDPCWYSWSLLFQEKYMALFVFRDRPNTLLRVHKEICQRTPSLFLLNTTPLKCLWFSASLYNQSMNSFLQVYYFSQWNYFSMHFFPFALCYTHNWRRLFFIFLQHSTTTTVKWMQKYVVATRNSCKWRNQWGHHIWFM